MQIRNKQIKLSIRLQYARYKALKRIRSFGDMVTGTSQRVSLKNLWHEYTSVFRQSDAVISRFLGIDSRNTVPTSIMNDPHLKTKMAISVLAGYAIAHLDTTLLLEAIGSAFIIFAASYDTPRQRSASLSLGSAFYAARFTSSADWPAAAQATVGTLRIATSLLFPSTRDENMSDETLENIRRALTASVGIGGIILYLLVGPDLETPLSVLPLAAILSSTIAETIPDRMEISRLGLYMSTNLLLLPYFGFEAFSVGALALNTLAATNTAKQIVRITHSPKGQTPTP